MILVWYDFDDMKEIGVKDVITYIISFMFLAFFLISVIVNIKSGHYGAGFLYLVLAILVLIPHRFLRTTQSLKFILLIVLFVVVAAINARNTPPAAQKYEYFALGDKFNITFGANTFSMVVKELKYDAKINVSGKDIATSGYFIIVLGDVVNLGSEAVDFKFPNTPELKDKQNRSYTLYGSALQIGKLQPSVAKEVSYVFEIPKDASGLTFIVKDKTDVAKSIDLKK